MPGAGSSAGENEYQPKIRDTQGVSRIFGWFATGRGDSGAETAIEEVTAHHGEGEANMDERH